MVNPSGKISPDHVLEIGGVLGASPIKEPSSRRHARDPYGGAGEKRVTIWNKRDKRKLSGNSAPFRKNLPEYCRKNPDWEEYCGQDKEGYVPGVQLTPQASPMESRRHESRAMQRERRLRGEEVQEGWSKEDAGHDALLSPAVSRSGCTRGSNKEVQDVVDGLRLEDTPVPLFVPSEAEAARLRTVEMAARAEKMTGDPAPHEGTKLCTLPNTKSPPPLLRQQEEWEIAKSKYAKVRFVQASHEKEMHQERVKKRRAEHEIAQLSAIKLSEARVWRFKRSKVDQGQAPVVENGRV